MNKIFRVIWSKAKDKWVVVAEKVAAKSCFPAATVGALTLAALLASGGAAFALDPGALPTGGQITAGSGSIVGSGNQMTVNQTSGQMIANWDSFNIGANAGVQFNQPNSAATALNRINDQNPSQILGSLTANGKVFLLNPAGIIFGQSARVDVGGLVASSLDMLDSDFLAGTHNFRNTGSAGSILNQGAITTMPGGVAALIAPKVSNEGTITTPSGSTLLAAANQVSLDFKGDGLITYTIDQGAVDALAENKGLIKADGGLVVMTAKAADSLTQAVVNNSGVIAAQTLESVGGRILLLSDMEHGETLVSGKLDASAPGGGDGGFIETSAAKVTVKEGVQITTAAPNGITGEWLIDPVDITIAASGGNVSGATIATALQTTNVTLDTNNTGTATGVDWDSAPTAANGDIFVNDNITVTAGTANTTLTLKANRHIIMDSDKSIDASGNGSYKLNVAFTGGSGDITLGSGSSIKTNGGTLSITAPTSFTQVNGASINSGAGDITITTDSIALNGVADSISGNGKISLQPQTVSRPVVIGAAGTAADFALDAAELATLKDGFSYIYLGRTLGTGLATVSGNLSFNDHVAIQSSGTGGSVTLTNDAHITSNGNQLAFFAGTGDSGTLTQTMGATIAAGNGSLNLKGDNIVLNGAENSIQGVSTLFLTTGNVIRPIILGSADQTVAGSLALTTTELDTFKNGCTLSNIGQSSFNGSLSHAGGITVQSPVTFYHSAGLYGQSAGAPIAINADTTVEGGTLNFWSGAPIALNANLRGSVGVSFQNNITVIANGLTVDGGYITINNGYTVNHGVHDFMLIANSVALGGNWIGTGARILQPTTATRTIGLGGGTGLFNLDAIELGYLSNDSPSSVTIGRADGTGAITGAAFSFNDPLNLRGGAITQTGVWTLGSTSSFAAGANNITLTQANDFGGAVSILSANNVSLTDTNALALGTSTVSGNLALQTGGALTQTGDLLVTGTTAITAGANDVTLDQVGNDFGGAVQVVSGKIVSLSDSNALALGAVTTTGALTVTAGGSITLNESVSAGGASFSNAVTVGADNLTVDAKTGTATFSSTVNHGANNFTLKADKVALEGNWFGTGARVLQPTSIATRVFLASGTLEFNLDAAELGYLSNDSPTSVTIGRIGGLGNIFGGAFSFDDPLVIRGGAISQNGDWTISNSLSLQTYVNNDAHPAITLNREGNDFGGVVTVSGGNVSLQDTNALTLGTSTARGTLTLQAGGALTQTGNLTVDGATSITAGANDVTLDQAGNDFGGAVMVVSGNNVTLVDANAMTLGAVTATGLIDIATKTGDLTLTGVINTSDATANAIKLNAGRDAAAGTSTGGNIIISGGTVNPGVGGIATMYSGSVADSTGLSVLIGSGSGRFRYNSDESASNYTDALLVGSNAVFREQPTLTVTPGNLNITYGDATPFATTIGSTYVNGDISAGTISGTSSWTFSGASSTAGKPVVGSHDAIYSSGLVSSLGYGFVDDGLSSNELTVNKKDLNVSGLTAQDKVYDATTNATLGGTAAITALAGDIVTIGGPAIGTFDNKNAGDGKAVTVSGSSISGADAGNYNLIQQAGLTADISKADLAVTGLTAGNKTYDATTAATLGGTAAVTALAGDTVNLGGTASGVFADKNVGDGKAITVSGNTISGDDADNYNLIQQAGLTADISKADLAVTGLTAGNKTYDATTAATLGGTAAVTALGADVVNIGGTAIGTFDNKNVGDGKAVTVSGSSISGADAGNYNLIQQAGLTANISKADLAVTGLTASNKTYDATTAATLGGTAAITKLGSDDITLGGTAIGTFDNKNVGDGKAITVSGNTISGDDADNYNLIQQAGLTADISKADLAVTGLTAGNKTYDATTAATLGGTAAVTALAGDTVNLGGTASGVFADKNVGDGKAVTVSGNTISGDDADNYNLIQQAGLTADISKADLTVTGAVAQNKVYDATTAATVTGETLSGVLGSDTVTVSGDGTFADKNAADGKAVTAALTLGGVDAGNYNLTQPVGLAANISKKAITATGITAGNKAYDTTTVAVLNTGSAAITNGAAADGDNKYYTGDAVTLDVTGATGAFATKAAADGKAVTVTGLALGGGDAGNYTVTDASSATADISKAGLTVTGAVAQNKVYDATTFATVTGETLSGVLGSDAVTVSGDGTFADKNAADGKAVTAALSLGGVDAGNYNLTQPVGLTADISQADLTITASDATKVYGQTPALSAFTSSGLQNGETIGSVTLNSDGTAATAGVAGSPYAITAGNATGGTFAAGNYTITYNNGSLTVTPAALSVTASDASKVYGEMPTLTAFTSSGLQNGETIGSVTLNSDGTVATAGVAGSPYAITAANASGGTFAAGNYTITYNNGSLTVTPAALAVTASDATKVYGQTPTLTAFTSSGLQNGETIGSVTLNSDGTAATAGVAGSPYTITAADATGDTFASGNYTITYHNGSLTVTPAALSVTASGATKTYGQTPTLTAFTSNGLQNGETIGSVTLISDGTAATAGVAGSSYAINASNATGGSFTAGNYTITYNNGSLTVTPAALAVTASDATKVYGQTPALTAFTSSGLQNGETIGSVTLNSDGTAATAGVVGSPYAITATDASGGTFSAGNYTITYYDGSLTVTPAAADDIIPSTPVQTPLPQPQLVAGTTNVTTVMPPPAVITLTSSIPTNDSEGTVSPEGTAPGAVSTGGATVGGNAGGDHTGIIATPSGITIQIVSQPSSRSTGIITVVVPKESARPGSSFSFPLPEQVSTATAGIGTEEVKVSLANGNPLPVWLRYIHETRTFVATDVPAGSLPITAQVDVGSRSWMVEVTEFANNW